MKSIFEVLLLFFVGYLGAVKFRCNYKYTKAGWYKYNVIPATWNDARMQCRYEGKPFDAIPHTWAKAEPDNINDEERCITLNSEGNFSDVNCESPHPYICYRPKSTLNAGICGTPDPEYRFEPKTNQCYKFHTTPRTYKRAHFVCFAEGGYLAIINSETESYVIRDLFAQYPAGNLLGNFWKDYAYIGFHNYDEGADWTTVEGRSLMEPGFVSFAGGEPNNSTEGEYCGYEHGNGLLNDLWCERHFVFIYEKDATYPPVCSSDDEK